MKNTTVSTPCCCTPQDLFGEMGWNYTLNDSSISVISIPEHAQVNFFLTLHLLFYAFLKFLLDS